MLTLPLVSLTVLSSFAEGTRPNPITQRLVYLQPLPQANDKPFFAVD